MGVGSDTGNLSFAVPAAHPTARVTGSDPEGTALHLAARKARRRRVPLTLVQGHTDRLAAEDGSVDHVVSTLVLHQLDDGGRVEFAREALHVLRAGASVTIADFGGSAQGARHSHRGRGSCAALQHLRSLLRFRLPGNAAMTRPGGDPIPTLIAEAGFSDAHEVEHVDHRRGRVSFVRATRL